MSKIYLYLIIISLICAIVYGAWFTSAKIAKAKCEQHYAETQQNADNNLQNQIHQITQQSLSASDKEVSIFLQKFVIGGNK